MGLSEKQEERGKLWVRVKAESFLALWLKIKSKFQTLLPFPPCLLKPHVCPLSILSIETMSVSLLPQDITKSWGGVGEGVQRDRGLERLRRKDRQTEKVRESKRKRDKNRERRTQTEKERERARGRNSFTALKLKNQKQV